MIDLTGIGAIPKGSTSCPRGKHVDAEGWRPREDALGVIDDWRQRDAEGRGA